MWGFNWIDFIIVVLLLAAVLASVKMGIINLLFVLASFFGAFFVSGWLLPHILPLHDRTLKTIINSNLVLLLSLYAAVKGFDLSRNLHWHSKIKPQTNSTVKMLDAALGSIPGLLGALLVIWLLSVMFMRLPFVGLSNSIDSSKITQTLTAELPAVPKLVAIIDRQINPNAQPTVLAQPSASQHFNYDIQQVSQAAASAQNSVVRITGFGCGGIITGSGFVIAPNLIMTNAHVIAGVKQPVIKYQNRSYRATPITFDANRDIAILRLSNLPAPAIRQTAQPNIDQTVAILGFPDGNYTVSPGILRNSIDLPANNIYGLGQFIRPIEEIQATIDFGSSGSPVISSGGQLLGMVFSKSDPSGYAYALNVEQLQPLIQRAAKAHNRVGTGACVD